MLVGSHVFDTLIKGTAYRVRGTVRSQAKADAITALYPEHHDRIDLVIVKDLAENRAFDAAVKGIIFIGALKLTRQASRMSFM